MALVPSAGEQLRRCSSEQLRGFSLLECAGLGLAGGVRKVAEVAALTWAGSQVTKLARAAGAVALSPLVDRLLVAVEGVFAQWQAVAVLPEH